MTVSDVMTPHAECIEPGASVRAAAQRMRRLDVGSLPVCENDRLVGIVTDRDIVIRAIADGQDPETVQIRDVMTLGVQYCFEDEELEAAVQMMEEQQIRRLVVLDANKRLAGIVSLGDIAVRGRDDLLSGEALEHISEPAEPVGV
jgi:CBS domain-containing protein